jgi:hypothetical protein
VSLKQERIMNWRDMSEKEEFPIFSLQETIGVLNKFEKKHAPQKIYYSRNLQI